MIKPIIPFIKDTAISAQVDISSMVHPLFNVVGGFNPTEKSWSVGMSIPNIWKNKIHVPNHQPVMFILLHFSLGSSMKPSS